MPELVPLAQLIGDSMVRCQRSSESMGNRARVSDLGRGVFFLGNLLAETVSRGNGGGFRRKMPRSLGGADKKSSTMMREAKEGSDCDVFRPFNFHTIFRVEDVTDKRRAVAPPYVPQV